MKQPKLKCSKCGKMIKQSDWIITGKQCPTGSGQNMYVCPLCDQESPFDVDGRYD